jgi:CheY-like chemotaxis protein
VPVKQINEMTKGPIIIVEDDIDDQEIYTDAIRAIEIPNDIRYFTRAEKAIEYLLTTSEQPFIILSDVNMPEVNGLQFKKQIQEDDYLREKGIPFVFISTNASASAVRLAHQLGVQGYFQKPDSFDAIKRMLRTLFDYWEMCKHINNT